MKVDVGSPRVYNREIQTYSSIFKPEDQIHGLMCLECLECLECSDLRLVVPVLPVVPPENLCHPEDLDSSPTAHIPGVFSQTEKASRVFRVCTKSHEIGKLDEVG